MQHESPVVQQAQILVGVMVLATVGLTVALSVVRAMGEEPNGLLGSPLMLGALGAVFAGSVVVIAVVRRGMAARARHVWLSSASEAEAETAALGLWLQRAVVTAALVEGPGMLGAVMVFLGTGWLALLAPAAAVGLFALTFPTPSSAAAFVRRAAGGPGD